MVDLPTATQLLVFGNGNVPRPTSAHLTLIAEGTVHVDYDDPDHVFLATVTQVPRIHLPTGSPVLGVLRGVDVRLVDVELANHVTLVLEGTGPVADERARHRAEAWEAWEAADGREGEPPDWPATRLNEVPLSLTDDVGTRYRFAEGEAGGDDRPWRAAVSYLPTPPPDARRLIVRMGTGTAVEVSLPAGDGVR